jgi:hypothetical protein
VDQTLSSHRLEPSQQKLFKTYHLNRVTLLRTRYTFLGHIVPKSTSILQNNESINPASNQETSVKRQQSGVLIAGHLDNAVGAVPADAAGQQLTREPDPTDNRTISDPLGLSRSRDMSEIGIKHDVRSQRGWVSLGMMLALAISHQ